MPISREHGDSILRVSPKSSPVVPFLDSPHCRIRHVIIRGALLHINMNFAAGHIGEQGGMETVTTVPPI